MHVKCILYWNPNINACHIPFQHLAWCYGNITLYCKQTVFLKKCSVVFALNWKNSELIHSENNQRNSKQMFEIKSKVKYLRKDFMRLSLIRSHHNVFLRARFHNFQSKTNLMIAHRRTASAERPLKLYIYIYILNQNMCSTLSTHLINTWT